MMQMLVAGGIPPLYDGEPAADIDKPRGYLEWERIKMPPKDPGCIAEAEGKVVKVISQVLLSLLPGHECSVMFRQSGRGRKCCSPRTRCGATGERIRQAPIRLRRDRPRGWIPRSEV
jgi:hypothetical protein